MGSYGYTGTVSGNLFRICAGEIPTEKQVKEILVSYVNDYCQDMVEERIREAIDPENNFIVKLIMESDLNDLSYLYQSGEYV